MLQILWIAALPLAAQVDGRVVFQNGPVPGLAGVVIGTGNGADSASVNDAMQVAVITGINGNANCQTGAAVLLEDHGTTSLLLCAGQTIGADTLAQPVPPTGVLSMSSGFLADDGVIVVPAYVNGFNAAVVRASAAGAEVLIEENEPDDQGNTVGFNAEDALSMADNGSAGFTALQSNVYWAPIGATARLCETDPNAGVYNVVATESALWYVVDNTLKRCQLVAAATVVDTPFPGGAGLSGGPATVDAYDVWPAGGGRTAFGLAGTSFIDGTTAYWVIDTSVEPPTARLVAPPALDPYQQPKAISPDGVHVVIETGPTSSGEPANYKENGSLFYTNDVPAPGGTRYIVSGYLWAAVANNGTVWFQAATATALNDIGYEQTLYRALPGQPLQRMVGLGDTVTTASGDHTVGGLQLGAFDTGEQHEHAASIANAAGAAVAIVSFDGTNHAVVLVGEPQIPDLAPFLNARVNGTIEHAVPVDVPFDLELGIENTGIGVARADLKVTFTPSVAYTGVPPANCTVTQDGVATISGIDCQAVAFGDLDTQGSAFITLSNVTVLSPIALPADLMVRMEVFQISGTPEGNTANSTATVPLTLRTAQANLNVALDYTIDATEHLIANLTVINEGPGDAHDVQVSLPGVPAPLILPPDCNGVGVVTCSWETIVSGGSKLAQIDFGLLRSDDVAGPFQAVVTSSSEDPDGPVATLGGDPEELLKTDVAVTATVSRPSDHLTMHVTVSNLSDITAYDIILRTVDVTPRSLSSSSSAGMECRADAADLTCGPFDLAPGATGTVSFGVEGYSAAALVRATVTGNEDRNSSNNEFALGALLDAQNAPDESGTPAKKSDAVGCTNCRVPPDISVLLLLCTALLRARRRMPSHSR